MYPDLREALETMGWGTVIPQVLAFKMFLEKKSLKKF